MVKKIFKTLYKIFLLPNLIHEILHYIPALCWNLNPQIAEDWSHIMSDKTTVPRRLVIVLAPAFVGLLFLPLVWNMVIQKSMFHVAAAIFWVGWMIGCGKDFQKAFFIFKQWITERTNHDTHP